MASISEILEAGLEQQRSGRLAEAEATYRRALAIEPCQPQALYLVGTIALARGEPGLALESLAEAVAADSGQAAFHAALGEAHQAAGQLAQAADCYRQAIALAPDFSEVHNNLAAVLLVQGERPRAIASYRRAIEIEPHNATAHYNLGVVLQSEGQVALAAAHFAEALRWQPDYVDAQFELGRAQYALGKPAEAAGWVKSVVRLRPDWVPGHSTLGDIYQVQGELKAAAGCYRRAIELDSKNPQSHYKLGAALWGLDRCDDAIQCFQEALRLDPAYVDACLYLSFAWMRVVRPDEAIAAARRALELDPASAAGFAALAAALQTQGDMDAAIAAFRRAVQLDPDNAGYHSSLLYSLNFHPGYDAATVFAEHRAWARRHAEPWTAASGACTNDRSPDRRLRVGYVSSQFFDHAVSYFIEPVIEAHDRRQVEVYCYANVRAPDAVTARFRARCDCWRNIGGLSDESIDRLVREDQIDILVDLAGHIGGNYLQVFARKPAPVQVTYLGYQNTTGMSAMDYRVTDEHADPSGATDAFYTERLVRLPRSFFCWRPPETAPEVNELPAIAAGLVTFGSFNSINKLTPQAFRTWARILAAVPRSRLVVLAYTPGALEREARDILAREGVDPARAQFINRRRRDEYLQLFQATDIALDTFPFNGHTTVCDALWMGVPSIMLEGDRYAARFGGTALVNLGLDALIARTTDQYVAVAAQWAGDLGRLAALRRSLRDRLRNSPLVDAGGFTAHLEAAYRQMWRQWCLDPSKASPHAGIS